MKKCRVFLGFLLISFIVFIANHFQGIFYMTNKDIQENQEEIQYKAASTPSDTRRFPVPVVILTYMRSGSTFLGELIQTSKDVFYLFEPLRVFQSHIRENKTFHYFNESSRHYDSFLDMATDSLMNYFQCKFTKLPIEFFDDPFIDSSEKARAFQLCMKYKTERDISRISAQYQCALMLENICMQSKYIVLKIIRIPMEVLVPLIEYFPKLLIVHMIRDPRATLSSQMSFGVIKRHSVRDGATQFCSRVHRDLMCVELMGKIFDKRYILIFYEDLAKNTNSNVKNIYQFIGLEFTHEVKTSMKNMTCKSYLCTKSSNHTLLADSWRLKTSFAFVETVDNSCAILYIYLGFKQILSESDLQNPAVKLRSTADKSMGDYRFS